MDFVTTGWRLPTRRENVVLNCSVPCKHHHRDSHHLQPPLHRECIFEPKIAFSNLAPLESSAILTRFGKFQALNPRAGRTWSWQQRNRGIQSTLLYLSFECLHQQFELYGCMNCFTRG